MFGDIELEPDLPEPAPAPESEPIGHRPAAPPPDTGHQYVPGPRFVHTYVCSQMCGVGAWGVESDEETIVSAPCPMCDRRGELQSTTDRERYAPPSDEE